MSNYRRAWHPGGTYLFRANLLQRHRNDLLLHREVKSVQTWHLFMTHGWVTRVYNWPYSTFHRLMALGVYPNDWAGGTDEILDEVD